jgi:hypothetical protein
MRFTRISSGFALRGYGVATPTRELLRLRI